MQMDEVRVTFAPWFNAMIRDVREKCISKKIYMTEEEFADICAVMLPLAMERENLITYDDMRELMDGG